MRLAAQPGRQQLQAAGRWTQFGKIAGQRADTSAKQRQYLNKMGGKSALGGLNGCRQSADAASENGKRG